MLRENTVFAQKIIDFYSDKGVECTVVDEHLSLLVTLAVDGRTHEFRYGNRAFAASRHIKKFYAVLERELTALRKALHSGTQTAKHHPRSGKYRIQEESAEEMSAAI